MSLVVLKFPFHEDEPLPTVTRVTSNESSYKPTLAATKNVTPLVKGVLQQWRGGKELQFTLAEDVDDAQKALDEHVIQGAVLLSTKPTKSAQRLASSRLVWAHRGADTSVTLEYWHKLLSGEAKKWNNELPFLLCLRAHPDPLEKLWVQQRPADAERFEKFRREGLWPVFENEQSLIDFVGKHPGAIALFVEGNLKLRGAPLSVLSIEGLPPPSVTAYFLSTNPVKDFPVLQSLLDSDDRSSAVKEWGWSP